MKIYGNSVSLLSKGFLKIKSHVHKSIVLSKLMEFFSLKYMWGELRGRQRETKSYGHT